METKAPVLLNAVPPYGHVISSDKWRNSSLLQSLKGVKLIFENELGAADFHLPNKSRILYVSECDIIARNSYKRKLVRYRNSNSSSFQMLVLVENTRVSEQYFPAVQKFVAFDLGLTLLPISGQTEASQLLAQMSFYLAEHAVSGLMLPLQVSPGVGRAKALALLQHFSSIGQLCNASPAELEPIVGHAAAQQIHNFFHKSSSSAAR
uniref:FA core complex associated protein 24 n=1 Tax=Labrus bergylta TaxID=56723 RepID=A0A3Q3FYA1_9LABR